ncbi:MAG: hypothetical protein AB7L66_00160 [Gemmatimonadales bacterium]
MKISRQAVFWIIAAGFVAFLAYTSVKSQGVECEVCMTFAGGERCAKASGPSKEDATQTAQTTACGPLASGMDQTIACSRAVPKSVTCTGS